MGKYWKDREDFEQFKSILIHTEEQLEEVIAEAKTFGKCKQLDRHGYVNLGQPYFLCFSYREATNGECDRSEYEYFLLLVERTLSNIELIAVLLEELKPEEMLFSNSSSLRHLGKILIEFLEKHQK